MTEEVVVTPSLHPILDTAAAAALLYGELGLRARAAGVSGIGVA